MQGFNMGRYHPPAALDRSLASKHVAGFNDGTNRAQKPTVRFEMPFDIWCTTCTPEAVIPQGVRFNAQKETVGKYYSTPIFSFRLKHGACGGIIEIRTDPENREYAVHEGGRRKAVARQEKDGHFGEILTEEERSRRHEDAFAHIEGTKVGKEMERSAHDEIKMLRKERAKYWHDSHTTNANLRRTFRAQRKAIEAADTEKAALAERLSLGIELLSESKSDADIATKMRFGNPNQAEKDRFWAVNRPLFTKSESDSTLNDSRSTPKHHVQKESIQRALFRKVKQTARLQKDPWSDVFVPRTKLGGSQQTRKREIDPPSSPPPSKRAEIDEQQAERKEKSVAQETPALSLVDYGSESDD